MIKPMSTVSAMTLLALVAGHTVAETQWWDHEYDAAVDPTAATPAWTKTSDVASGTAKGGVWSQRPNHKWTGYKLTDNHGSWQLPTTTTAEIRFRHEEQAEDGLIFVNWPKQWQAILKPGVGANELLSPATSMCTLPSPP